MCKKENIYIYQGTFYGQLVLWKSIYKNGVINTMLNVKNVKLNELYKKMKQKITYCLSSL